MHYAHNCSVADPDPDPDPQDMDPSNIKQNFINYNTSLHQGPVWQSEEKLYGRFLTDQNTRISSTFFHRFERSRNLCVTTYTLIVFFLNLTNLEKFLARCWALGGRFAKNINLWGQKSQSIYKYFVPEIIVCSRFKYSLNLKKKSKYVKSLEYVGVF